MCECLKCFGEYRVNMAGKNYSPDCVVINQNDPLCHDLVSLYCWSAASYFTSSLDRDDRDDLASKWLLVCVGNLWEERQWAELSLLYLRKHSHGVSVCNWLSPGVSLSLSPQTCCLCCQTLEVQRSLPDHLRVKNTTQLTAPLNLAEKHHINHYVEREQTLQLLFDVNAVIYRHVISVL